MGVIAGGSSWDCINHRDLNGDNCPDRQQDDPQALQANPDLATAAEGPCHCTCYSMATTSALAVINTPPKILDRVRRSPKNKAAPERHSTCRSARLGKPVQAGAHGS